MDDMSPGAHPQSPAPNRRRLARPVLVGVGVVTAAAAAFGIGDALATPAHGAAGAGGGSAQVLASSSSNSNGNGKGGARHGWGALHHRFASRLGGLGALGALGPGGGPLTIGKVTAIGNGTITVSDGAGSSRTVDTTSSTHYFSMLTKATSSAVSVRDEVAVLAPGFFHGAGHAKAATATPTAFAVVVIEPYTVGTVASTSSSEIVVTGDGGLARDVLVNGSTTYTEAGSTVSQSSVSKGTEILAYGSAASDPTKLQTTHVLVLGPRVAGIVSSVSGSTIDVRSMTGTETISTTSSTIVRDGNASASLSDVKKGMFIEAIGHSTGNGTLSATAVRIAKANGPFQVPASSGAGAGAPFAGMQAAGGLGGDSTSGLAGLLSSLLG